MAAIGGVSAAVSLFDNIKSEKKLKLKLPLGGSLNLIICFLLIKKLVRSDWKIGLDVILTPSLTWIKPFFLDFYWIILPQIE